MQTEVSDFESFMAKSSADKVCVPWDEADDIVLKVDSYSIIEKWGKNWLEIIGKVCSPVNEGKKLQFDVELEGARKWGLAVIAYGGVSSDVADSRNKNALEGLQFDLETEKAPKWDKLLGKLLQCKPKKKKGKDGIKPYEYFYNYWAPYAGSLSGTDAPKAAGAETDIPF